MSADKIVERLISLLGLAQKAGKVASGELAVEKAVRSGKAKLVLVAEDSSESTKKGYRDISAFYQVTLIEQCTKEQLGACIGKSERAALAITDDGFCRAVLKHISASE